MYVEYLIHIVTSYGFSEYAQTSIVPVILSNILCYTHENLKIY